MAKDDLDDEPLGLGKADDGKPGNDNGDPGDDTVDAGTTDAGTTEAGNDLDIVLVEEEPAAAAGDAAGDAQDDGGDAQAGETGDDELSEDEKKGLTASMQDRLRREKRVTARKVEAAEERVRAEADARRVSETRTVTLELTMARLAAQNLKYEIRDAKAELIAAQEAGETAKAVDAQEKLNALQIRAREVQGMEAGLVERVEKAKTAPAGAQPVLRAITQQWMGRNRWFDDPKFAVAKAAAVALSQQLAAEGISPDDQRHYAELDRRLHADMPGLRQRLRAQPGQRPAANRPGPGTIVAPAKPSAPRQASNRITLDKADLQTMRDFGMDPKSEADLKQFARTKMEVGNG